MSVYEKNFKKSKLKNHKILIEAQILEKTKILNQKTKILYFQKFWNNILK